MPKEEKIKIAITAGIASVIILILVLFLALSGKKSNDDEKLSDSISDYASVNQAADGLSAITGDMAKDISNAAAGSEEKSTDEAATSGSSSTQPNTSEYKDPAKNSVSGNSFYATNTAVLRDVYKGMRFDAAGQLQEMYTYWNDGNTAAVRDLAHLERFEVMSFSLTGTNDFYYYGDKNDLGQPNGTGIAVYANDQYYFGGWENGKRSGNGTWISFYPSYSEYVVTEHLYTGGWAEDLPCGEGQEHYDYDYSKMNSADVYLQNAIGTFKDGLYDGEMYIITVDMNEQTTEWDGTCTNGTWDQVLYAPIVDKIKIPVLSLRENHDHHLYMTEAGMKNNGVTGIITGGSMK
jgi:hypothetical protein